MIKKIVAFRLSELESNRTSLPFKTSRSTQKLVPLEITSKLLKRPLMPTHIKPVQLLKFTDFVKPAFTAKNGSQ